MKINALFISAFGGIKNLKLFFNDGFNVVYGNNEIGKSTIMAFIKMMFYGSERGSSQLSKNIRKKYTPWNGSVMAGSIDFEHNGKRYRLEKEFRASNSGDKATLCDLDFGTRQAVSGEIGSKFFGLSLQAFERSVFIGQFGFPESDTAAEGEINSKLSNIALTGDESVSFEEVNSRLSKAKLALMSKSGRAGEYDKNLKSAADIKDRLEKSVEMHRRLSAKKSEIEQAVKEAQLLQRQAVALKGQIDSEQDIRNAEKFKKLLELKNKLDLLNAELKLDDGTVIDEMYLRKLQFCISKVQSAEQKVNAKRSEMELLEKSIDAGLNPPADATEQNAELLEKSLSALKAQKIKNDAEISSAENVLSDLELKLTQAQSNRKAVNIPLLITGMVFLILSIVLFLTKAPFLPFVGVGCAVFFTVFSLILRPLDKKGYEALQTEAARCKNVIADLRLKGSEISGEISAKASRLAAIKASLSSSAAVVEKQQQLLSQSRLESEGLEKQLTEELSQLLTLFCKYKKADTLDAVTASLGEITNLASKQKEIKTELNFISKDIGGISYEEAAERLSKIDAQSFENSEDFDLLKQRYSQLLEDITEIKSRIAGLEAEIKSSSGGTESPEFLKKSLLELETKILSQKKFCDATDIAVTVLTESFGEIRRSYGSVLEKKAGSILNRLTNGNYDSMSISKAFEISVEQADVFGSREIGYLSSGTADQAYLSLRLAIAELITEGTETLPIFLDDALAQYDDGRTETALSFLNEYSKNTQTIMFTCHKNISQMAKAAGADIITIL